MNQQEIEDVKAMAVAARQAVIDMGVEDPTIAAINALHEEVHQTRVMMGTLLAKAIQFEEDAKKMGEMFSPDKLPELLGNFLGGSGIF